MPDKDQLYVEIPPYTPPRHVTEMVPADMILERLAQLPTRRQLIRFGVWIALGLCVLAVIGAWMWWRWVWACSLL
jgi:uncharacterized membrane protein